MKIKYLGMAFASLVLAAGCEADHRNDNLYDSAVYFVNNASEGVSDTDPMYDVQETAEYPVYVYCSGYYGGSTTVSISVDEAALESYNAAEGTAYRPLPAGCYSLTKTSAVIENRKAAMTLEFDVAALAALSAEEDYSDLEDYVVPLALHSTDDIPVSTKREYLGYEFVRPDLSQAVLGSSVSGEVLTVQGTELVMTVSLPFENRWSAEWDMEVSTGTFDEIAGEESTLLGNSLPAKYSFRALPSAPVVENGEVRGMEAGVNSVEYRISVPEGTVDGIYAVKVKLGGVKLNGKEIPVEGGGVNTLVRFEVGSQYTPDVDAASTADDARYLGVCPEGWNMTAAGREAMTFTPESASGDAGANAIDGDTSTKWENRYGSAGYGPTTIPFLAAVDLGSERSVGALEVWRRPDRYMTDLGCFEVYAAESCDYGDKENIVYSGLTYLGNVDFGDSAGTARAMFRMIDEARTRYLIFNFIRSNRNDSCISMNELNVWCR